MGSGPFDSCCTPAKSSTLRPRSLGRCLRSRPIQADSTMVATMSAIQPQRYISWGKFHCQGKTRSDSFGGMGSSLRPRRRLGRDENRQIVEIVGIFQHVILGLFDITE